MTVDFPGLQAAQAADLLTRCATAGIDTWVAGGWAVDALVGRQTRPHGDLDLAVNANHVARLLDLLRSDGFEITTDWSPVRLELTAPDGRVLDLHPVVFDATGEGTQKGFDDEVFHYAADGFTTGWIGGRRVPCLSAAQQLRFREGYEPREVDRHDVALLRHLVGSCPVTE
jgi:lincosamide nucleotidyltransferase A/C/D/E